MDQGRDGDRQGPGGRPVRPLGGPLASSAAEVVNEPGSLVRNDLVTPDPEPARAFYATVFDFTLDGNPDLPAGSISPSCAGRDGHEIGGTWAHRRPRPAGARCSR